jgi:N-acetylmuramoyl-L-alanine amidase
MPEDGPNALVIAAPDGRVLGVRQTQGDFRIVDPDLDAMARTAYGEGRGEGAAGMAAIGAVIQNRSDLWGRGYTDVVHEGDGAQFNAWKEQRDHLNRLDPRSADYQRAVEAVLPIVMREAPDPTKGALEFFNPRNVSKAYDDGTGLVIGNHKFRRGGWETWHKRPPAPLPIGNMDPEHRERLPRIPGLLEIPHR